MAASTDFSCKPSILLHHCRIRSSAYSGFLRFALSKDIARADVRFTPKSGHWHRQLDHRSVSDCPRPRPVPPRAIFPTA